MIGAHPPGEKSLECADAIHVRPLRHQDINLSPLFNAFPQRPLDNGWGNHIAQTPTPFPPVLSPEGPRPVSIGRSPEA